mgnify:CR=1 FL=1
MGVFSKSLRLKVGRTVDRLAESWNRFLRMATETWTAMAIRTWMRTAFLEVPQKALIRRGCLMHLKNSEVLPKNPTRG